MIYFIGSTTPLFNDRYTKSTFEDCLSYFQDKEFIEVDTETTGLDPHTCSILCMQLGTPEHQYVIEWSYADIDTLKELFYREDKTFIFQNAKFDLKFLRKEGILVKKVYDTMLAERYIYGGRHDVEIGLYSLVKKYCDYELDKSIRGDINKFGLSDEVIIYAAEDVMFLTRIMEFQKLEIEKNQLLELSDLENNVVKVFSKMEYDGIKLDTEKWLGISKITENARDEIAQDMDTIVREEPELQFLIKKNLQIDIFGEAESDLSVNWSSPKQKVEILNKLGLKINSTADAILVKNRHRHRIIPKLLDYAKMNKLASSFGKDYLKHVNKVTNRVHPDYWQILDTGRISVKDPNLNQIPSKGDLAKEVRSCFIPEEGSVIVGGDYSGMELRIIAELSQDPLWVKAFKEGGDLHSILCAETFDISIEDVRNPFPPKPTMTYRDVQKTVNFGLAYGMSKFKLSSSIDVPLEEADAVIKKFFKKVPGVAKFLTNLGNLAKKRGFIRSYKPYRRIRYFDNWDGEHTDDNVLGDIERAGKNTPIQGTNADIIKAALIDCYNIIEEENLPIKIILAVYDEIQCEVPEHLAEEWKGRLERIMIEAAEKSIKSIPVVADCGISNYWTK